MNVLAASDVYAYVALIASACVEAQHITRLNGVGLYVHAVFGHRVRSPVQLVPKLLIYIVDKPGTVKPGLRGFLAPCVAVPQKLLGKFRDLHAACVCGARPGGGRRSGRGGYGDGDRERN